jgi:hypothetical protein
MLKGLRLNRSLGAGLRFVLDGASPTLDRNLVDCASASATTNISSILSLSRARRTACRTNSQAG